jgi:hypothetical protein
LLRNQRGRESVSFAHTFLYNELKDAVLAAMLKELITDELIIWIQYNEIPPKVELLFNEKGEISTPYSSKYMPVVS